MGQKKPGVMIYWEMFDMLQALPPKQMRQMLAAICSYARYGVEPEEVKKPAFLALWTLTRQRIDADSERYETICSKNQINGYISSFKRIYAPEHGLDPEDREALSAYIGSKLKESYDREQSLGMGKAGEGSKPTPSPTPTPKPTSTGRSGGFLPPSQEEVKDYCLQKGYPVDPEQFVNYYTANGWKVGKNPMKDWKAAVRTWKGRETAGGKTEFSAYGSLGREV